MKKLFTLVAATLFCASMFATNYHETTVDDALGTRDSISEDYKTREWNLISPTAIASSSNIKSDKVTHNDIYFDGSKITFKKGSGNGYLSCTSRGNVYIPVPAGAAGTIYMTSAGSSEGRWFGLLLGKDNTTSADTTQRLYSYYAETPGQGSKGLHGPQSFTFAATDTTMRDGKAYLHLQDNDTEMKVSAFKIVLTTGSYAECTDPNASIIADRSGFVGDAIDLEFASSNTSDIVWDIKKNSAATEDATITAGKFTATVAGTYVVTATQVKDATYCAVEESVTLTISAKTPVTAITLQGASASPARIGTEVTLTATPDNAADTIYWKKGDEVVDGAHALSLSFTPDAVGNYTYTIYARNQYNKTDEWASKDTTITVAKSSDATLSDLKVNGVTIEGFAPATLSYPLGEIGVYEKPALTYTVNDEGYATAVLKQNILTDGADSVVVTAEDGTTVNNYVITYTRAAATGLAEISTNTTWDWANAGSATAEQKASGTLPLNTQEFNFADVLINPAESFNAAALAGIAQFANRGEYFQGTQIKFNTTVAGHVVIDYSNTGGDRPYRHVEVNGVRSAEGSDSSTKKTSEIFNVNAGDVVIKFYIPDASSPKSRAGDVVGYTMGRVYKIVFTKGWPTAVDNTVDNAKAIKTIENGQIVIIKNGVRYNVLGAELR